MHTDIHARVKFELTIPVLEQAKMVHALDHAVTVIGSMNTSPPKLF
jgi:hypothetical protein